MAVCAGESWLCSVRKCLLSPFRPIFEQNITAFQARCVFFHNRWRRVFWTRDPGRGQSCAGLGALCLARSGLDLNLNNYSYRRALATGGNRA
jgi:hypothetical protein